MRFLKSLICNCLYINNFYKNKELPINYYGIKKLKKFIMKIMFILIFIMMM